MESQPQNPEFKINPDNFHLISWNGPKYIIHIYFYLFIYTMFNGMAQLVINNYSTLWPSKIQNEYVHIYIR